MVPLSEHTRRFLPWDAPLLPQAVRWFARDWKGEGPLDLGGVLVIVPTKQSGRRLRAGLAELAAAHGQAVFAPQVVTPEWLVAPAEETESASRLQAMLAWVQVLLAADLGEFRAVFPINPPVRDFSWALRLAGQLTRLQATLGESGLGLADVAARRPADFAERQRWLQLGELGQRHAAALARAGWSEPQEARRLAAESPAVLTGITRLVVLAVPDPLPLAVDALRTHAQRLPVEIVIHAPESAAADFDAWGRPVPAAWAQRSPPWEDFSAQVHLLPDATAQAEAVAALAAQHPAPDGALAVGLADAALAPLVAGAVMRTGRPVFDPAGERFQSHSLHHFLRALAALHREASYENLLALARSPATLDWLGTEAGGGFSPDTWLRELDELHAKHLPATLEDAQRAARTDTLRAGLARLAGLRAQMLEAGFAAGTEAALTRVFRGRRLDPAQAEDRRFNAIARKWSELVRVCAEAAEQFPRVGADAWWELALELFGAQSGEEDKPDGALELQGWLELPFEDAPQVVVAGCHDGTLPEAVTGDVFLPENLRGLLGLKGNAARFARDAYLLHALVASRRTGGRVDLLLGKVSPAGEPLRPSRLLLQCADAELPARVTRLFRPLESRANWPAWERTWQLAPRRAPVPAKISATGFRSYLDCPFRFYLRHVLKMEAVDAAKQELDAFDFGSLCHAPLERLADPAWRDCTDERAIAAMLVEALDREAAERFGGAPSVPLVAQLESARQRLRWAARVQAAERAAGWVIDAVEKPFELDFGGLQLRGRIDRIDRHADTGAWRVVDYKTSDTARLPGEAHFGPVREDAPAWARVTVNGREKQWTDLQLPLYVHALPLVVPGAQGRAACGYFNLPKAVAGTALAVWEDYSAEWHDSALRCAEEAAAAVRAGRFWPPNEAIAAERDEFAALFHRGVAASVAWEVTS